MLEKVKDWMRALLGESGPMEEAEPERHARRYETADEETITAVVANKLAAMVQADSTMEVLGEGERAEKIRGALEDVWENGVGIVAQALGKGGKVLLPIVQGGRVAVHVVDQSRMAIRSMQGNRLTDVTILCDKRKVNKRWVYLVADYTLSPDGRQRIGYRACDGQGREEMLKVVPEWEKLADEIVITGTDRLLLGFMRCPRDNRTEKGGHGVPITFGAEQDIRELMEHMRVYRREFHLSRMMLGLDAALWRDPVSGAPVAANIASVRKTVQDSDDPFVPWDTPSLEGKGAWQVYAPPIRHEAMEARYQSLCRRVETDCGLSCGILTERQRISYANRDEIRAAMYDTFCVVRAVRVAWERALRDLAYAVDALLDLCGLNGGEWELRMDWDYGLVESTEQTFNQNRVLYENRLMSGAELRQWALGGTMQAAHEAVAAAEQERGEGAE